MLNTEFPSLSGLEGSAFLIFNQSFGNVFVECKTYMSTGALINRKLIGNHFQHKQPSSQILGAHQSDFTSNTHKECFICSILFYSVGNGFAISNTYFPRLL